MKINDNYYEDYYEEEVVSRSHLHNNNFKAITWFTIILVFITGVGIGTVMNYSMMSSELHELHSQIQTLNLKTNNQPLSAISYSINNSSLSRLYYNIKDSIVVVFCQTQQMTLFGTQDTEVQGSGFVYEYEFTPVVITNYHVIHNADEITVAFSNGNIYSASLLGSDPYSDLAVLSVNAPTYEYKPLEIISSSSLNVGDPVIAIGSPFGLGGTMTTGIVSQLGRTIEESLAGNFPISNIIQTSTPINPGNSGGPLLNFHGQVVGITTAIIDNSEGLGFAIPSSTIIREIGTLIENGSYSKHPWIGISGVDMDYEIAEAMGTNITYGWLVSSVVENGPATNGGLLGGNEQVYIKNKWINLGGDIIIAIDGNKIINGDCLMSYLEENCLPGQVIILTVLRNNHYIDISLELGVRPLLK